jgi:toxin ParE1/3/4
MRRTRKSRAVIKRPAANKDLEDIWRYISRDNESRADGFIKKLNDKFFALARNPEIGRCREELRKEMRSFPVGNYVIFYCVLKNGIGIVRILHGSRDIRSSFFEDDDPGFEV